MDATGKRRRRVTPKGLYKRAFTLLRHSLKGKPAYSFQFCSSKMNLDQIPKYIRCQLLEADVYGNIYKAIVRETQEEVTLKVASIELEFDQGITTTYIREISILRMLSDSACNVVKLRDVERRKSGNGKFRLHMVFDDMKSNLYLFINRYRERSLTIPPLVIKKIMYELVKGVASTHGHGVMHRNLTPRAIWIETAAEELVSLKIAMFYFGRATDLSSKAYTNMIGVSWYRSPELLLGQDTYSLSVDMWNVGCIFAELYRREALFVGWNDFEILKEIFSLLGTPNEEVWPGVSQLSYWHPFPQWKPSDLRTKVPDLDDDAFDLLSKLLVCDPSKRISAKRALLHPYFSELSKA